MKVRVLFTSNIKYRYYDVQKINEHWGKITELLVNSIPPDRIVHFCKPYDHTIASACSVSSWRYKKHYECSNCRALMNKYLEFMLKMIDIF